MLVTRLGADDLPRLPRAGPLFGASPAGRAADAYLRDPRNVVFLATEADVPEGFLRGTALRQIRSERPQRFLYEIGVAAAHRRRVGGGIGWDLGGPEAYGPRCHRPGMELAMAMPVLPGKRGRLEELAKTLSGPKKADFHASEKRVGMRRESWFLQSTPQGDLCVVYGEAENVLKSVGDWGASKDPFDLWLKAQLKEITGIDFSLPMTGPPPVELLQYRQ